MFTESYYNSIILVMMILSLLLIWPLLHFIIIPKLVLLVLLKKDTNKSMKMPPGPYPYPIIGSILKLGQKPHQSLFDLSKTYGPLMTLKLGSLTSIVISSPEIAKEALTKHDLAFSSREIPYITRVLDHHKVSMVWSPISDNWRTLRKLCASHIFSPQKLHSTSELRQRKVKELMKFVSKCCTKGEAIDIGQVAFTTIMNSLSNTLFSKDFASYEITNNNNNNNVIRSHHHQNLKELVEAIMEDSGKANLADIFPLLRWIDPQGLRRKGEEYTKRLLDIFNDIFDDRIMRFRASNLGFGDEQCCDDVLDSFLQLLEKNDGSAQLSRQHFLHLFVDLFVAGIETTRSTIEWAITELVRDPKKMTKLKQELLQVLGKEGNPKEESDPTKKFPYLEAIVKETFRLHPPVPFLHHKSKSEAQICGFKVPKDTQVLINLWAIGRNPNTWSDPNSFLPERFLECKMEVKGFFDFELIPFGAGRRMCPALPLAHRSVHFILASLVHCFDWEIVDAKIPQELDMSEKYGLTIRRAQPLKLIPIPIN